MRILLTGSAGYVGSALLPKLEAAGHRVTGVDIGWFSDAPHKAGYYDDVRKLNWLVGAECIIHLAAIANDPSVNFYPKRSWETSVLATQQLAQMAVKTGCRFIYASSVSVYGADRGMVTENMDVHPISDYNKTKMCAERVLMSYWSEEEMNLQIVRPATVCGLSPRMRLDLTVNMLTMQALTKGVMTVHGGGQFRPSIHIDDLCDLYLWLIDHPEQEGIFNAGFENYSVLSIAEIIQAIIPCDIEVTNQIDARSYKVNSDKLLSLGFKPKKTIYNAIHEIMEAYTAGKLTDDPRYYNLGWMQKLGIKDE